jgi:cytochrome c biogenesis protein CcmG/thiol:disulfide interchange protein DsbE
MRRLIYLLPLVVIAAFAVAFYVQIGNDPQKLPSALIDKPLPTFNLPPIDGNGPGVSNADVKGKVVLINVWASWCPPCRVEHPILMGIASSGVAIYGVNYKDKPEDAKRFLAQLGNPFIAIGADKDGKLAVDLGVYGYPETFIVDAGGTIRYRHAGPISKPDWDLTLLPIMKKLQQQ